MPVWNIQPIEDRPEVTLSEWAVFEVPLNGVDEPWTRHLAGWSCKDGHGQVCSPVESFDPATASFVTRSGRVYQLSGAPGLCADGEYTLNRWLRIYGMDGQLRDVTLEVFLAIQDAADARLH